MMKRPRRMFRADRKRPTPVAVPVLLIELDGKPPVPALLCPVGKAPFVIPGSTIVDCVRCGVPCWLSPALAELGQVFTLEPTCVECAEIVPRS
jgi:hypothetical protein